MNKASKGTEWHKVRGKWAWDQASHHPQGIALEYQKLRSGSTAQAYIPEELGSVPSSAIPNKAQARESPSSSAYTADITHPFYHVLLSSDVAALTLAREWRNEL